MTQYRRSAAGLGYKGIPALIFIALNNYGVGTQSHEEKLLILNKIYGCLRGYLPVIVEGKEFNEKYSEDLQNIADALDDAQIAYAPEFEGLKSSNPDEKAFVKQMLDIYILLIAVTAKSKVIDDQKPNDEEVNF